MAERPRLKETDEILYSVAKKRRSQSQQPVVLPTDVLPPPILKPGEESPLAKKPKPAKRPSAGADSSRGDGEPLDRNPLDFGKYDLKQKPKRPKPAAIDPDDDDFAAPDLVELVGAASPELESELTPAPIWQGRKEDARRRPVASSPEAREDDIKSIKFQDREAEARQEKAEQEAKARQENAKEAARQAAEAARAAKAKEQKEQAELQERRTEAAKAAEGRPDTEARRKMLEDDRYRESAIRQLSSRFEEEFSQQFERKKERKAPEKPSWVPEKGRVAELPLVLEFDDEEEAATQARPQPPRQPTPRTMARQPEQPERRAAPQRPTVQAPQQPMARTAPQGSSQFTPTTPPKAEAHPITKPTAEQEAQFTPAYSQRPAQQPQRQAARPTPEAEAQFTPAYTQRPAQQPQRQAARPTPEAEAQFTPTYAPKAEPRPTTKPEEEAQFVPMYRPKSAAEVAAQLEEKPVLPPLVKAGAQQAARPAPQPQPSKPAPKSPPKSPEEDEAGADAFFAQFEREIQAEEEVREEDFKETLAQKFMRERERYLEELGIADQMEAEKAQKAEEERLRAELLAEEEAEIPEEPPRRRLNLAIQPEMHLQEGEVLSPVRPVVAPRTPPRPVTYSRNAAVEPQRNVVEETENGTVYLTGPDPEMFRAAMNPEPEGKAAPTKKSAEQMLLELGEQTKRRAVEKPLKAKENAQFSFSFKNFGEPEKKPAEEEKPERKKLSPADQFRTRVIALAASAGILVIALMSWGVSTILDRGDAVEAVGAEDAGGETSMEAGKPLEVYSSYTATGQTDVPNVLIKRTGVTVGNLNVAESVVVEELAKVEGPVTLSNVIVDDMIYVKASGANELDLVDVRANRIVINNDQQLVTIRASGNTNVGTVEVRTGAVIEQGDLADEATGIQNVIVNNEVPGVPLDFAVNGAAVQNVSTLGSVNATFEGAAVETMNADGDLSLSGTGKVQTLSAGIGTGQGAGDIIEAAPVSILIKGVAVGHLNIKSAANVNVSAEVDSMAVADPVNIGGNGMIASLVLNEKFGNRRLAVDITGVNIQQLTANAEAVIYSNGTSTINTLTANASAYTLGNKVNTLVANADGVIYENEPDQRRVSQGIAQPQSKADNPHLDYSLTGASAIPSDGGDGESVSLGCEHGPELGGFRQGDGSRSNPFYVEDAAMLAHVTEHPESHFVQANDIDIASDSSFVGGFPVLCSMGTRFSGSYDGKGYAIMNLSIYAEQEYVGLFAENTGTIQNVRIDSGDVTSGAMDAFAGSVVGFNYQGGQVLSCSNGASVIADMSNYAGGVVGYNFGGKVHDCYNTARVTGGEYAGGIVGMNRQDASVTGSYNAGLVEANGEVGGIAGGNEEAVITNCFYLIRTAEDTLSGTGTGGGNSVAVSPEELSSAQMAATLAAGNAASLWRQSDSDSYPYPVHQRPSNSSAPAAEAILPASGSSSESASAPLPGDNTGATEGTETATEATTASNIFEEDFADYQPAELIE